jgi:hypothetical protein
MKKFDREICPLMHKLRELKSKIETKVKEKMGKGEDATSTFDEEIQVNAFLKNFFHCVF